MYLLWIFVQWITPNNFASFHCHTFRNVSRSLSMLALYSECTLIHFLPNSFVNYFYSFLWMIYHEPRPGFKSRSVDVYMVHEFNSYFSLWQMKAGHFRWLSWNLPQLDQYYMGFGKNYHIKFNNSCEEDILIYPSTQWSGVYRICNLSLKCWFECSQPVSLKLNMDFRIVKYLLLFFMFLTYYFSIQCDKRGTWRKVDDKNLFTQVYRRRWYVGRTFSFLRYPAALPWQNLAREYCSYQYAILSISPYWDWHLLSYFSHFLFVFVRSVWCLHVITPNFTV